MLAYFIRSLKIKNRIREYRERYLDTQDQLAATVGVSRETIISLEKFKYIASLKLAWKRSQVFAISIEELFCFEREDTNYE